METLVIKQTLNGWVVWDRDYEEELSQPYVDRNSAEIELDNIKTNRAEKAWTNFCERYYGGASNLL